MNASINFRDTYKYLSLFFLSFILLCACNSNHSSENSGASFVQKDTTDVDTSGMKKALGGEQLPTLFIENNASNRQLEKLLSERHNPGEPRPRKDKIVFQFFRDKEGNFRLLLIPCSAGNQEYLLKDTIQPYVSSMLNGPWTNDEVFLGDLQLTAKNVGSGSLSTIDSLKKYIFNPTNPNQSRDWKFIWLIPDVVEIEESRTTGPPSQQYTFKRKYLVYKVEASGEMPALSKRASISLEVANPSPPRRLE